MKKLKLEAQDPESGFNSCNVKLLRRMCTEQTSQWTTLGNSKDHCHELRIKGLNRSRGGVIMVGASMVPMTTRDKLEVFTSRPNKFS